MNWIVIVVGLASTPTFHPEPSLAACQRRIEHINTAYGAMVHARCVSPATARRAGYSQPLK